MAQELATAYISLVPSFRGGQRSIQNALGGAPDEAGRQAGQSFGSSFTNIAKKVIIGAAIYKTVGLAAGAAKTAVFDFNSQLQNSTIAFTTMLGSGQKAQVFLDQLQAFAKSTPFEFGDLVQNTQTLMGMGVAAKDIIPDLTALGDSVASVGGSSAVLNNTISAFGQTMAKGTLDMGNMNQLLQGGIPNALKILASSYHVTTGEMVKMISAGKVQSSEALPLLIKGIEHGTKATAGLGGMMDKQSTTFTGALSNIKDGLTQTTAKAFRPFFDMTSAGMQKFAGFLSSPIFARWGDTVSRSMQSAFKAIQGINLNGFMRKTVWPLINALTANLKPAFDAVRAFVPKVGQAFQNLLDVVVPLIKEGIGPLSAALKLVWPALSKLGDLLVAVTGWMKDHKVLVQSLVVVIGTAVGVWKLWTLGVAAWSAVTRIATVVAAAFNAVMDANPIVLVVTALAALAAGFVYAYNHSETFRRIVQGVWSAIKTAFFTAWHFIRDYVFHPLGTAIHAVSVAFTVTKDAIETAWGYIKSAGLGAWHFIRDKIFSPIKTAISGVSKAFRAIGDGLKWAWDHTLGYVFRLIKDAINFVRDGLIELGIIDGGPIQGLTGGQSFQNTPGSPTALENQRTAGVAHRGPVGANVPTRGNTVNVTINNPVPDTAPRLTPQAVKNAALALGNR